MSLISVCICLIESTTDSGVCAGTVIGTRLNAKPIARESPTRDIPRADKPALINVFPGYCGSRQTLGATAPPFVELHQCRRLGDGAHLIARQRCRKDAQLLVYIILPESPGKSRELSFDVAAGRKPGRPRR